jgi:predicted nucleotidyltransferase
VEALKPERIYLFGSRARRDAGPGSDYDLLIVVKESVTPRFKLARRAFRSLCGVGASKDVVVLTSGEFDRKAAVAASLPATVLREGNLLYAS